jgi:hypothetical protein
VRDNETLQELDPKPFADKYGWEFVKTFPLQSLEQVLKVARTLNPAKHVSCMNFI